MVGVDDRERLSSASATTKYSVLAVTSDTASLTSSRCSADITQNARGKLVVVRYDAKSAHH